MADVKNQKKRFAASVTAVLAVLARQAGRLPGKLKTAATEAELREVKKPANLLKKMSKKKMDDEDWGDGGVWQKEIIMGNKCEPLDFSGVISYDINGNPVNKTSPE